MRDLNLKVKSQIISSVSSSIDQMFNVTGDSQSFAQKVKSEDLFEEIPVDFRHFVESDDHMGVAPLSERQYMPAEFLLGGDPTQIFDNGNTTAICEWGKGSGKDHIASLVILYIVYVLLCMKNPQKHLKMNDGEALDLLNVAMSSDQAGGIFFEKFKQRVLRWKWLKSKYSIKLSGINLGQLKKQTEEEINNTVMVTRDAVLFPKQIRALSGHSKGETQEGHGLLCFVLDEAAGFDDADKIYNTLRSSAVSRFGDRYKCFILSFPRYAGDFIEKMYQESLRELHWYGDKASTWEVKPEACFSGKWFELRGERIPYEYKKEFEKTPEDADTKYRCRPPNIEDPFIERPEKLSQSIIYTDPVLILSDNLDGNQVTKDIVKINGSSKMLERIMTFDLGVKNNSAAMSIFHKEIDKAGNPLFIQDFCTAWEPDELKKLIVSFTNIKDVVLAIKDKLNIVAVYFDQWQSVMMVQELSKAGIIADVYHLDFGDYKNFKERLYLDQVKLQNDPVLLNELKRLKIFKGNKVDHPKDGSKDRADTAVGAVRVLSSKLSGYSPYSGEGEFIQSNLGMDGTYLK